MATEICGRGRRKCYAESGHFLLQRGDVRTRFLFGRKRTRAFGRRRNLDGEGSGRSGCSGGFRRAGCDGRGRRGGDFRRCRRNGLFHGSDGLLCGGGFLRSLLLRNSVHFLRFLLLRDNLHLLNRFFLFHSRSCFFRRFLCFLEGHFGNGRIDNGSLTGPRILVVSTHK